MIAVSALGNRYAKRDLGVHVVADCEVHTRRETNDWSSMLGADVSP